MDRIQDAVFGLAPVSAPAGIAPHEYQFVDAQEIAPKICNTVGRALSKIQSMMLSAHRFSLTKQRWGRKMEQSD